MWYVAPYVLSVVAAFATLIASKKPGLGWSINLGSLPFWAIYFAATHQWPYVPLMAIYGYSYLRLRKENDVDLTQISKVDNPEDSWTVEIVNEDTGQEWALDEDGTRYPKLVSGSFRGPITHVTDGDKKLADYNE